MDLIFNELSLLDLSPDIPASRSRMHNLLLVCKEGREHGTNKLAVRDDFFVQRLSSTYTIADWLGDQNVPKTQKDLLLAIHRYPYIDDSDESIINRFISSHTFLPLQNAEAEGLAAAYLYGTIAVSFDSSTTWNSHELELLFSEEGFDQQIVKVKHASSVDHILVHKDWVGSKNGITLSITNLSLQEKEINLRDDHGKDVLKKFSKKLIRSQYIIKIINSLPYNSFEQNFIRQCHEDGKIELVLTRTDEGFGLVIQTTGKTLLETIEISKVLELEYRNSY